MTLITSISGIRGTIGGKAGEALTPFDIVKYTGAFGTWVTLQPYEKRIVIGRDARQSGEIVSKLVATTLQSLGIDVIDLDLATTPTIEMAVVAEQAAAGIIISASHNPKQWNALKLLNHRGEFISAEEGETVIQLAQHHDFAFAEVGKLGSYSRNNTYLDYHIEQILSLDMVDRAAIADRKFTILVDAVNSVGGIAVPALLQALGVENIIPLYCEPNGIFPHNPEPLPIYLETTAAEVCRQKADLGIVVDPDVDRLAFICEDGSMFGEEYTLVAVADYVLQQKMGNTVSNMSSTKALRELTQKYGSQHYASAVGEVNVVEMMKAHQAIIGGEGNGGIILPELHYGRDALVGIALFLSYLAQFGKSCSLLRAKYPFYQMLKTKIDLTPDIDVDAVLAYIAQKYQKYPIQTVDGVYIRIDDDWVHLRKSNTEPIIRIYAESSSKATAEAMIKQLQVDIGECIRN